MPAPALIKGLVRAYHAGLDEKFSKAREVNILLEACDIQCTN